MCKQLKGKMSISGPDEWRREPRGRSLSWITADAVITMQWDAARVSTQRGGAATGGNS